MNRSTPQLAFIACAFTIVAGAPCAALAQATARGGQRSMTLNGELRPYESVTLAARVPGYVEEVLVDRGSVVREGQPLVRLRAPELAARVAEAQARVQALEAERRRAEAQLGAVGGTYRRLQDAAKNEPGAVSANELTQAEQEVAAAEASVAAQASAVRAAMASVEAVRQQEVYLEVKAPFAGIITERLVHPGALVTGSGGDSNALLRLESVSRLRLVVPVPEANVATVTRGTTVTFTVSAYADRSFTARVARIPRSVDIRTRTMAVECDVDNAKGSLTPGLYATVAWPLK